MKSHSLLMGLWGKQNDCGPRLVERGSHNRMDCEGCPTLDNSYFITEEGGVERRWSQTNNLRRQILTSRKVYGGRTQCQHYLLHIGVELKLALQGGASQTSYKSPWDLESADSVTEGAGMGR